MEGDGMEREATSSKDETKPEKRIKRKRSKNVFQSLMYREIGTGASIKDLETLAEELFVKKEFKERKYNLPGMPRATYLVVFSPDGTKIASTHGNHSIYVTDIATGENIKILSGHPRTPWCIAFHPKFNNILASGCLSGQVRIWDLNGDCEIWNGVNEKSIASLAFHPTERLLVFAIHNTLNFWEWDKPKSSATKTVVAEDKFRYVAFDKSGTKLITGLENTEEISSMSRNYENYLNNRNARSDRMSVMDLLCPPQNLASRMAAWHSYRNNNEHRSAIDENRENDNSADNNGEINAHDDHINRHLRFGNSPARQAGMVNIEVRRNTYGGPYEGETSGDGGSNDIDSTLPDPPIDVADARRESEPSPIPPGVRFSSLSMPSTSTSSRNTCSNQRGPNSNNQRPSFLDAIRPRTKMEPPHPPPRVPGRAPAPPSRSSAISSPLGPSPKSTDLNFGASTSSSTCAALTSNDGDSKESRADDSRRNISVSTYENAYKALIDRCEEAARLIGERFGESEKNDGDGNARNSNDRDNIVAGRNGRTERNPEAPIPLDSLDNNSVRGTTMHETTASSNRSGTVRRRLEENDGRDITTDGNEPLVKKRILDDSSDGGCSYRIADGIVPAFIGGHSSSSQKAATTSEEGTEKEVCSSATSYFPSSSSSTTSCTGNSASQQDSSHIPSSDDPRRWMNLSRSLMRLLPRFTKLRDSSDTFVPPNGALSAGDPRHDYMIPRNRVNIILLEISCLDKAAVMWLWLTCSILSLALSWLKELPATSVDDNKILFHNNESDNVPDSELSVDATGANIESSTCIGRSDVASVAKPKIEENNKNVESEMNDRPGDFVSGDDEFATSSENDAIRRDNANSFVPKNESTADATNVSRPNEEIASCSQPETSNHRNNGNSCDQLILDRYSEQLDEYCKWISETTKSLENLATKNARARCFGGRMLRRPAESEPDNYLTAIFQLNTRFQLFVIIGRLPIILRTMQRCYFGPRDRGSAQSAMLNKISTLVKSASALTPELLNYWKRELSMVTEEARILNDEERGETQLHRSSDFNRVNNVPMNFNDPSTESQNLTSRFSHAYRRLVGSHPPTMIDQRLTRYDRVVRGDSAASMIQRDRFLRLDAAEQSARRNRSVLNKIANLMTFRIQIWDFSDRAIPSIKSKTRNVVVEKCKIYNDASIDISSDGKLLAWIGNFRRIGVHSLEWETLGAPLYVVFLHCNRSVSLSISPTSRYLLVGWASPKHSQHTFSRVDSPEFDSTLSRQVVASIFELEQRPSRDEAEARNAISKKTDDATSDSPISPRREGIEGPAEVEEREKENDLAGNSEDDDDDTEERTDGERRNRRKSRPCNVIKGRGPSRVVVARRMIQIRDETDSEGINCIRWAPKSGQGIVYGTNTGELNMLH